MRHAIKPMALRHPAATGQAIAGQAQVPDAEGVGIIHQDLENGWMEVQMQVAIDMVERETGGLEFFELGMDLGAQWSLQPAIEKIFHPGAGGIVRELVAGIDQARDLFGTEGGMTVQ